MAMTRAQQIAALKAANPDMKDKDDAYWEKALDFIAEQVARRFPVPPPPLPPRNR